MCIYKKHRNAFCIFLFKKLPRNNAKMTHCPHHHHQQQQQQQCHQRRGQHWNHKQSAQKKRETKTSPAPAAPQDCLCGLEWTTVSYCDFLWFSLCDLIKRMRWWCTHASCCLNQAWNSTKSSSPDWSTSVILDINLLICIQNNLLCIYL